MLRALRPRAWFGGALLLGALAAGCGPAGEGTDAAATPAEAAPAAALPAAPAPEPPADPLAALLDALVPSAEALLADPDRGPEDEAAWLAEAAAALAALPRPEPTVFHGPGRVRFGARHAKGPLSLTRVRIEDGGELPLHDHRDLCGVLLGLSGRLQLRQLEPAVPAALRPVDPETAFVVRETGRQVLLPGRSFIHARGRDDIHGLHADGSGGEYLELLLRFSDQAGSRVLRLDPLPLDAAEGLYQARWE